MGIHEFAQFGDIESVSRELDCQSWKIETFTASGDNPGWIYEHNAHLQESGVLMVSAGKICLEVNGEEDHVDNEIEFTLDLQNGIWSRV